ncbi:MAG: LPS assembly lipoprotein LptE [Candidatus Deferrimicrobiaceae bacterium]
MDPGRTSPGACREIVSRRSRDTARRSRILSVAYRAAWGFSLLLFLFPPACGYRLQGKAGSRFSDPGIRVDLRPFANESFVPDGGAYLTARLRDEMRGKGFRGRFERSQADYIVEGTVREIREEVFSYGEDKFALEHRMTIFVDIRVVEITQGRLLWKEDGLTDAASYFAGPDFQYTESNRRMAFEEVCRRVARRIGETLREIL